MTAQALSGGSELDANCVVLGLDGTHRVSQTIRIEEPVGGGVPTAARPGSTWLLAALIVLGRRADQRSAPLAFIAAQACSFPARLPRSAPLDPHPGAHLSVPDASGVVTVRANEAPPSPKRRYASRLWVIRLRWNRRVRRPS